MNYPNTGNRKSICVYAIAAATFMFVPNQSFAGDLTASGLLAQMNDKEQYHYIAGVVAGLGTARYVKDGNDKGSACIDKWFYETPDIRKSIYAAFEKFGDKSPSAIIYAMAAKACGK